MLKLLRVTLVAGLVFLIPNLSGFAAGPDEWVPMRWQGEPAMLDLLNGTPINCVLVNWAGAGAYAKEARGRGIAVLGVVHSQSELSKAAGLDGVVLEQPGRESCPAGVLCLSEGVAPRVRAVSESEAATATPTTEPWIEANTWRVRSLRSGSAGPAWLGFSPEQFSALDYVRSIADAAAAGGAWVVSLEDAMLAGLRRKEPKAAAAWKRIADYLSFFKQHAEWRRFSPTGPLGIVHDAASKNADMYDEYLNLIARRRVPYRIIERAALAPGAIEGLKAVLATELAPPSSEERRMLNAFVEQGGLVVAASSWGPAGTKQSGKGRLVVYADDVPDPEALAKDMFGLIGRAELGVRLFNTPSVLPYVTAGESGKQLLVQLINYASAPAEAVTVRISGDYRTARLYSPDSPVSEPTVERSDGRVQVGIRSIPVYAALLLEK